MSGMQSICTAQYVTKKPSRAEQKKIHTYTGLISRLIVTQLRYVPLEIRLIIQLFTLD